jgi:hypothetical protein
MENGGRRTKIKKLHLLCLKVKAESEKEKYYTELCKYISDR